MQESAGVWPWPSGSRGVSAGALPRVLTLVLVAAGLGLTGLSGCEEQARRPVGATCGAPLECESGLCFANQCVDPAGDLDGDGLTNGFEAQIGSNGASPDTDGDGIGDRDELGPDLELLDADRDGKPDILESAIADADGDCITDQFDADDATPNTDLSPMIPVVCPRAGICGEQRDRLRAACPDGQAAVCVFTDLVGFADPEVLCDGVDENCDGRVDESFPNGCPPPFVHVGSGGVTVRTARHRATLVIGQPALDVGATSRFRAFIGSNPILAPQPPEAP